MTKNKFIYIIIITVFLISVYLIHNFPQSDIKITINNITSKQINGLKIKSNAFNNDIKIKNIAERSKYTMNLIPSKKFDEGNMTMHYFDKNGNEHKIYLLGYFEKSYSGNIDVTVNSIDTNGILSVNVENNVSMSPLSRF
ncbi:hypothetical protein [Clostridium sp. HV4-5-A1G]|uniref:hypothetical protein n=1 Tax=Clostridium sp. HV4-5-A1G TaxID=2004595 RepID=UPI0012393259|nr:hypothetical protein [Clostridium sp. HV4-5-A1G]KAA8673267.1 hypothetical protein F3O63_09460 [Clostridium sp. HV4-5-A1G]CAB1244810.1 conserved hypothetical protein [Clostridiaceae bacterium BL-3]